VDIFFIFWLFQHLVIFSASGFFTGGKDLALGNWEHWVRGSCFCKDPPEFQHTLAKSLVLLLLEELWRVIHLHMVWSDMLMDVD
jgi:hypothetical protein